LSFATKITNAIADAAKAAATAVSCALVPSTCPKQVTMLQMDVNQLNNTPTRLYNDELSAKAGKDGACTWDTKYPGSHACTVFNGNGAPIFVFPATGTLMSYGGMTHRASRTPPSAGYLPYCVPEWYRLGLAFHDSSTEFKNDPVPTNTYYCSFWTP
jgi:hypothetical protein